MIVIGLVGRARSGKDTFLEAIVEYFPNLRIRRIAFADALKEEVAQVAGMPLESMVRQKSRFRGLWQHWGTELRREENPDYWVNIVKAKIHHAREQGIEVVVVTDVRFQNEADLVDRDNCGTLIRIERRGWFRRMLVDPLIQRVFGLHQSERLQDDIEVDITLHNNGSLEKFRQESDRVMCEILLDQHPGLETP